MSFLLISEDEMNFKYLPNDNDDAKNFANFGVQFLLSLYFYLLKSLLARVAELVDALDSKSSDFGRVGSIPTSSTFKTCKYFIHKVLRVFLLTFDKYLTKEIHFTSFSVGGTIKKRLIIKVED